MRVGPQGTLRVLWALLGYTQKANERPGGSGDHTRAPAPARQSGPLPLHMAFLPPRRVNLDFDLTSPLSHFPRCIGIYSQTKFYDFLFHFYIFVFSHKSFDSSAGFSHAVCSPYPCFRPLSLKHEHHTMRALLMSVSTAPRSEGPWPS